MPNSPAKGLYGLVADSMIAKVAEAIPVLPARRRKPLLQHSGQLIRKAWGILSDVFPSDVGRR